MRYFRVLPIAAAVMLSFSLLAAAQAPAPPSPEALQAAKDLVAVVSADTIKQLTASMAGALWRQLEQAIRKQYPTVDAATLVELRDEFERTMHDAMVVGMSEAPAIYARHFTAAEMKEITAFYRTPTGAKALTVMPQAVAELGPAMQQHIQATMPKVDAAFDAILKKHGLEPK